MKNGQMWKDVDGNDIQAHGGCIIEHEGMFYWYGENKGQDNCPGRNRVDVIGVSCYSSRDLVNWKYEGLVISADRENPMSPLYYKKVLERPKVIYSEKTKKFVLWMHLDSADYTFAGVGIAVSDSPIGPFELIDAKQPNRLDSRDMTIFKDHDGVAYLFHSSNWNKMMAISRLNEDYTDVDGFFKYAMIDQSREAPALTTHNGKYYMVTSGCTGWDPNSALYSVADFVNGTWELIDNPCEGENYRRTFEGQSTYIFEVGGKKFLMLDHWKPNNLKNSGYSFLPLEIDEKGVMTVRWEDEFNGI
jgi:beta-xylosidase